MKTWQLVVVQLWVLCFAPVWAFVLVFAPLTLVPPNPAWVAFFLLVSPPFIALACSIAMWTARWKNSLRWQKNMMITLILFPPVSVIPVFVME